MRNDERKNRLNKDELVATHRFTFNPKDPGDGQLTLHTDFYDNGDGIRGLEGGYYTNQRLHLQSGCNATQIELYGASINPEVLRELANQLDMKRNEVRSHLKNKYERHE